jgi:hypothetical protein
MAPYVTGVSVGVGNPRESVITHSPRSTPSAASGSAARTASIAGAPLGTSTPAPFTYARITSIMWC